MAQRIGDTLATVLLSLMKGETNPPPRVTKEDVERLRIELNRLQAGPGPAVIGAWTLLADVKLSASAASFDFDGLPSGYKHLAAVMALRTDRAATVDTLLVRINNDSGAVYDWTYTTARAATLGGGEAAAGTAATLAEIAGNNSPANNFTTGEFLIADYANTTKSISMAYRGHQKIGTAANQNYAVIGAASYRTAGAVSRITFLPGTGPNFVLGSRISLYGVP